MDKLVSVYMSAYNAEKYILESVNSVLNQTYKNIQLIVVDDCSTDKTLEILKSVDDVRLEVYQNSKNMHMAYSWNEGLKHVKGEYVAHIDADDMWLPDKTEKQVAFLEEHPEYGACFTHADIIDENNNIINDLYPNLKSVFSMHNLPQEEMFAYFIDNANHFCHCAMVARTDIVKNAGNYDITKLYLNDYDLWLKVLCLTPIYVIPEPLTLCRRHNDNNSVMNPTKDAAHDNELVRIITDAVNRCPDDLFLKAFADRLKFSGEHTHEEIELEKAFFLIDGIIKYRSNAVSAIDKFISLLRQEKYLKLAQEKFGFSLHDFYKLETVPSFYDSDSIALLNEKYSRLKDDFEKANNHINNITVLLESSKKNTERLEAENATLNSEIAQLNNAVIEMQHSFFWRLTSPVRRVMQKIKSFLSRHQSLLKIFVYLKGFLKGGFRGGSRKLKDYERIIIEPENIKKNKISDKRKKKESKYKFDKNVKFSVLVPLYNTPMDLLTEMIDSVINQTYNNWELCLADGSDCEHNYVGEYCQKLAKKDGRIKYKKLSENRGISENTNACIEMSSGDYIALFDHDDLLHPSALFRYMQAICEKDADFIYCDEDKFTTLGEGFYDPYYKPNFAPDNLRGNNYICHFTVFKKSLLDTVGKFRKEFDGSQDHDLILRLTEKAENIVHIPEILYHWRISDASVASDPYAKPYTIKSGQDAVREHLSRIGLGGAVESSPFHPNFYRIKYDIIGEPLVSILIPTYNHVDDLDKCIKSIINKSTYKNYEIIIIENNSDEETFRYYETLKQYPQIKVVVYKTDKFNYSAINNYGAQYANGEHLIFLNNDVEIISEDWIQEMLMYSQREDIGIVGAKLYYPDDTIQHAGVTLGIGGVAGHLFKYFDRNNPGYFGRAIIASNYSCVTFACAMMKRRIFDEMGGLDESFEVAFNDVDMCMRVASAGYLNCFTPYAELYHYESKSRGLEDNEEKIKRFQGEIKRFHARWKKELEQGDPFYNPNLTLDREDCTPK